MAEKRALFRVFLETLRDPNLTSEHKIKCLSLVVIPVLTTTLEDPYTNNSEVVTDSLVSNVFSERSKEECMFAQRSSHVHETTQYQSIPTKGLAGEAGDAS